LQIIKDFQCRIDISDVLELKRTALNQHESQMNKLIQNEFWLTLEDISNGEFLKCFLGNYEFFNNYYVE